MEPDSDILKRIGTHIKNSRLHLRDTETLNLLISAALEIEQLEKRIAEMEKAFLLTKTHHV